MTYVAVYRTTGYQQNRWLEDGDFPTANVLVDEWVEENLEQDFSGTIELYRERPYPIPSLLLRRVVMNLGEEWTEVVDERF